MRTRSMPCARKVTTAPGGRRQSTYRSGKCRVRSEQTPMWGLIVLRRSCLHLPRRPRSPAPCHASGQLLPGMKDKGGQHGASISVWVTGFRRYQGVNRAQTVFHSFRPCFATAQGGCQARCRPLHTQPSQCHSLSFSRGYGILPRHLNDARRSRGCPTASAPARPTTRGPSGSPRPASRSTAPRPGTARWCRPPVRSRCGTPASGKS